MNNTITVKGIGAISSAGTDIDEAWKSFLEGERHISEVELWDTKGCLSKNAGEIKLNNHDLQKKINHPINSSKVIPCERGELLFIKAFEEALKSSNLSLKDLQEKRVGIFLGTSLSGFTLFEREYIATVKSNTKPNLSSMLVFGLNTASDRLAYEYKLNGPRFTYSTACSASLHSVIWAYDYLKEDKIDYAICGGTDPISLISLAGFSSLQALAKEATTPFSKGDQGLSIGEGSGVVILGKDSDHDLASNYGYIAGYGSSSDAYHPTASDPTGSGIKRCMNMALEDYQDLDTQNVFIASHGTGTPHNDKVETLAIKQSFSDVHSLKMASAKSMIGHTLGASGTIELAYLCKSMRNQVIYPTAGFGEAREGCDLNYTPNKAQNSNIVLGVKNAFAFGGNNVTVSVSNDKSIVKDVKKKFSSEKIAIVGVGQTSLLGIGLDDFKKNIHQNETSFNTIPDTQGFLRKFKNITKAGFVDAKALAMACKKFRIKNVRKMDKISQMSCVAAASALKDAVIKITPTNSSRVGLIGASGTGHIDSLEKFYSQILKDGIEKGDPGVFPNTVVNAHLGHVSIELKIKGYSTVLTQGCMSGIAAMEHGIEVLRNDMTDIMLVGSSAEYNRCYHQALIDLGLSNNHMYPYNNKLMGHIQSEGSVYFVLERLEDAKKNKRKIYGVIDSLKSDGEPTFPTKFNPTVNPLESLLSSEKESLSDIEYVYGNGMGIPKRDHMEFDAIKSNFPDSRIGTINDKIGYMSGSNTFMNIASWIADYYPQHFDCKNNQTMAPCTSVSKSNALFTCLSEGGNAGYIKVTPYE